MHTGIASKETGLSNNTHMEGRKEALSYYVAVEKRLKVRKNEFSKPMPLLKE